jgi:hypothetical protein
VASYGSVAKKGGRVALLGVNARNHHLLSITRLLTLFDSFDSEAEAVRSFAAGVELGTPRMHVAVGAGARLPQ